MDLRDNNPQKKWKNREFTASFEFALTGIITAFKEERNMRKHLVSAILVVLAGLIFRVSATEWLFLLMAVFLVIALEIVNSAIENVVDLASNYHFSMLAKNAKDMAAGAVLVVSCYALITGMIVFIPKIWHLIFNSGFVAILGRPNVGKSTFLNHVMGQKIAIMSDKAQTTRNKIMGIYTTDKEQIVFIDTPGIHKPKTALGDFMVESAYSTLREVDTVLFMVPADEPRGKGDNMIIERLKQAKVPVILVINKIDKVHPDQLLEQIEDFRTQMDFKEIIPISALQGNNVSHLVDVLSDNLEEGFQYFPADQITDHPERFLVSEMIREKVLQLTREEIPHSVAVVIDEMKRDEDTDKIHIRATIMVERDSQKGIVIGKQGSMLKKIGTLARKDIEVMLGDKVFLETWVKVKKNWRDKKLDLADFGYNEKEY